MNTSVKRLLLLASLLPWLGACSMGQMIAKSTVHILDGGVQAMNGETDLAFAKAAIPANLKMIEGLLAEDPTNEEILWNISQGYYGYSFGFIELEDKSRAKLFYDRCYHFGARALASHGVSIELRNANPDNIEASANKLGKSAVPALFWTASCWAKQIDLNRDDPSMIAQLPSTERLMQRVLQLQPDYYYGAAHLYYGVYYGGRAPMFGGDFSKADQAFSEARSVTGGKLLMMDVLQAEYLERQRLNQSKFHQLLTDVIDNPVGSFPEMALANQIARDRARFLLTQESEWF